MLSYLSWPWLRSIIAATGDYYLVKMKRIPLYVRFHAAHGAQHGDYRLHRVDSDLHTSASLLAVATHGFGILLMLLAFLALGIAHLVYLILAAVRAYPRASRFRVPTIICFRMVR